MAGIKANTMAAFWLAEALKRRILGAMIDMGNPPLPRPRNGAGL